MTNITPQQQKDLDKFIVNMRQQLENNAHRRGWDEMGVNELIERLRKNVDQLESAYYAQVPGHMESTDEVVFNAADVANIAMMIGANIYREE